MKRANYGWEDCVRDLALTTRLTLTTAQTLTWPIRELVHPYDALPSLIKLSDEDAKTSGAGLADLLRLSISEREGEG